MSKFGKVPDVLPPNIQLELLRIPSPDGNSDIFDSLWERVQVAGRSLAPGRGPLERRHVESYTPGTYRYVPVRTDLYRPILRYSMYRYVLLEKCRITVQVGTYQYVLVEENVQKYVRVRT